MTSANKLMFALIALAPLPAIAVFSVEGMFLAGTVMPFVSNLADGYVLLLFVFGVAAGTLAVYHSLHGPEQPIAPDILVYALAAAVGPTFLLTIVDYVDSYFTEPGVGGVSAIAGAMLGGAFGAAYRVAYSFFRDAP
jgi:hypothetical protein